MKKTITKQVYTQTSVTFFSTNNWLNEKVKITADKIAPGFDKGITIMVYWDENGSTVGTHFNSVKEGKTNTVNIPHDSGTYSILVFGETSNTDDRVYGDVTLSITDN